MIPKADRLSEPQLRDDAPRVLDHVADALESDRAKFTDELVEVTAAHGVVRYQQNFQLRELLIEYNLLRAVVIDQVTQQLLDEGVQKFADSFHQLFAGIESKRKALEAKQVKS